MALSLNVPARPAFNYNLEALRGVAASIVVWHHIIFNPQLLDAGFKPTGIASYNPPGHFAVLIFFLLSGYVIGNSHPHAMRVDDIPNYLHKRFVRLYPMYIVAVLAGVVASLFTLPLGNILLHLVFGQGAFGPVMFENNPLWSLQSEVLFYLLFIPVSILRWNAWIVAASCAILGVAVYTISSRDAGGHVATFLIGFSFWTLGLALSRIRKQPEPIQWGRLLSALLLMLSVEYLNPLLTVANRIIAWINAHPQFGTSDINWLLDGTVRPYDYTSLVYAAAIMLCFANITGRFVQVFRFIVQFLPAVGFLYAIRHLNVPGNDRFFFPCLFWLLSTILYFFPSDLFEQLSKRAIQRLIPLGAISYGIYVIHFPILVLFGRVSFFSGSTLTLVVRTLLFLLTVWGAAYLLDKKFQPWAKRLLT